MEQLVQGDRLGAFRFDLPDLEEVARERSLQVAQGSGLAAAVD
jgi:hypothetical protein